MLSILPKLSPLLLVFFFTTVLAVQRVVDPTYSQYAVSSTVLELTDRNRADPIQPASRRRLAVTALTPSTLKQTCKGKRASYMPVKQSYLADAAYSPFGWTNGTFSTFRTTVADGCTPIRQQRDDDQALIIFSPAASTSRLVYQVMAHSLVSKGFKVLMIDHPYDADYVQFANGDVIKGIEIDGTNAAQMIDIRMQDVAYLLRELQNPRSSLARSLGFQKGLRETQIGMLGHSLGGATVAKVLSSLSTARVMAGVNLDGDFFGNFSDMVVKKPYMLFGQTSKVNSEGSTWPMFFQNYTTSSVLRKWFSVSGTQHYSFSDLPLLVESLGAPASLGKAATPILGTLSGRRGQAIISEYVAAFFEQALYDKSSSLLDSASPSFPEVNLVQ